VFAARFVAVAEEPPDGAHEYEYVVVPPVAVAVAVPVLAPQLVFVAVAVTDNADAGWVIVTVVDPGQLFPSTTFTVYVPAPNVL
jgi:hypothetical protein